MYVLAFFVAVFVVFSIIMVALNRHKLLVKAPPKLAHQLKRHIPEKPVDFYNHARSLKSTIECMERGQLSEVFLCGRMFRVSPIQGVLGKIRFFEIVHAHTDKADLVHVGDFETNTQSGWVAKAFISAFADGNCDKEVLAELVMLRMGI